MMNRTGASGSPARTAWRRRTPDGIRWLLAAALRPFLSIYNEGAIEPRFAAPILRLALEETGTNQTTSQNSSETVEILAEATGAHDASYRRRAVVRFRSGEPFQILYWGTVE